MNKNANNMISKFSMICIAIAVVGCATPGAEETVPQQFSDLEASSMVETESEFIDSVAGKQLKLLNDNIQATLMFNEDGTATGSLVREGGEPVDMNLEWDWENQSYCRTGKIGDSLAERKCESVRLFPGTGVLLTYIDSEDPQEYWIFE